MNGAGRVARETEHTASFELGRHGIVAWFGREAAETWAACGAFEWVALGYLAVSTLLMVMFAENLAHPARLIGLQCFVALVILLLCRTEAHSNRLLWADREHYLSEKSPTLAQ